MRRLRATHRVKPGGSRARKAKTHSAASHTWPASGAAHASPPGAAVSNSSDAPSACRRTGAPAMRGAHAARRRVARTQTVPARLDFGKKARAGSGPVMQVSFTHTWEEDEAELRLRVPLGTAPRASLDVYGALARARTRQLLRRDSADRGTPALTGACRAVSDVLVKVYAPGRTLLLDLLRPVDDGAARVQVSQEDVRITLRKARAARRAACALLQRTRLTGRTPPQREPGLWGELTLKADKAALLQRRQASIDAKARATLRLRCETQASLVLTRCLATRRRLAMRLRAPRRRRQRRRCTPSKRPPSGKLSACGATRSPHARRRSSKLSAARWRRGSAAARAMPLPLPRRRTAQTAKRRSRLPPHRSAPCQCSRRRRAGRCRRCAPPRAWR